MASEPNSAPRSRDASTGGSKVWLITGCSTGIGREIARAALEAGDRVGVSARDPAAVEALVAEAPDRALAVALDVTRPDQVRAAVAATEARFGRIDVLVNNAGYGYVSSVEEGVDADVRRMFDTNFFGAIELIKAVLPGMRAQGSGLIVNMSSVTGYVARPGNVYYSTSKFALESLSEGLAEELAPFGIRVSAVAPGVFRTDWNARSMQESPETIDDYAPTVGERRALLRAGPKGFGGDPRKVGDAVVMLSRLESPPLRLLLGADAIAAARGKIDALAETIERWEAYGVAAGEDDAPK